jgi:lipopolysaccharide biosynthesis glycosyltransferase
MKRIIITGSDEKFYPFLEELIDSLFQWDEPLSDAIGVLDLGLSQESLQKLKSRSIRTVSPDWDRTSRKDLIEGKPHLRALTARPFLPKYFPGYDLYLWIDADAWVQNRFAVDWLFQSAASGSMGLVPQTDRAYVHSRPLLNWRKQRLQNFYRSEGVGLFEINTYFNAGVYALRHDAPHWESWARYFQAGLRKNTATFCDQTALNFAIWKDRLPVHPLPALCNWCCHLQLPSINLKTKQLCEPFIPHKELGILHMTAETKDKKIKVNSGKGVYVSLRFNALKDLKI